MVSHSQAHGRKVVHPVAAASPAAAFAASLAAAPVAAAAATVAAVVASVAAVPAAVAVSTFAPRLAHFLGADSPRSIHQCCTVVPIPLQ